MVQARPDARNATAKPPGAKPAAARAAASGQFVLLQDGQILAEAPVSKERLPRIAGKMNVVGKVISGYADAAAKAKRTGQPHIVTYLVTPDGKAKAIPETPATATPLGRLDSALARAKARGAAKINDILKGEDMLTAREFGPLMGASHETINVKRKRHEVLGLEGATRGVKYPRWQITDDGLPLPGLAQVFDVLGEQPWTVFRFLRSTHAELGGQTALEALKAGRIEAVLGAATNQAAGAFN